MAARQAAVIRAARNPDALHQHLQCGLLVNRTATAYAGVLASLMVGSPYVPLNPRFPSSRLRDILSASAIDTLVVDHRSITAAAELLKGVCRPLTVLLSDAGSEERSTFGGEHRYVFNTEIEHTSPVAPMEERGADHGAYLLFTSGSTGTPKGVLISHANAVAYVVKRDRALPSRPRRSVQPAFRLLFRLVRPRHVRRLGSWRVSLLRARKRRCGLGGVHPSACSDILVFGPGGSGVHEADAYAEARQLSNLALEPVLRRSAAHGSRPRLAARGAAQTQSLRTSTAQPKQRSLSPPIACRMGWVPILTDADGPNRNAAFWPTRHDRR